MKMAGLKRERKFQSQLQHSKPLRCSYNTLTNNILVSFQVKYPVDCSDYHAEDIKATTEYAHSEL